MTQLDPKALEAAARKVALENDDYTGPILHWEGYLDDAEIAITAYLAAMREAGFVMVPLEPSGAQIAAGWRYAFQESARAYRAMIAAAQEGE